MDMKRPATSPSPYSRQEKRPKFSLPEQQLLELNEHMTSVVTRLQCGRFILNIKDLIPTLLLHFLTYLTKTDLKSHLLLPSAADGLLKDFEEAELAEFGNVVTDAINSGDWQYLSTHAKLQNLDRSPQRPGIAFTIEAPEEQATRLHKMFHGLYQGEALKSFLLGFDIYNEMYNPRQHFGRSISILQSSGTGKSRLVEELGNRIPTLSICFRESSSPRSGWPPNDEPAYRFFNRKRDHEYKGEELAAAFLGAVMHIVACKLRFRDTSTGTPKDWLKDWDLDIPTDPTNSSRYKCFIEVETEAEKLLLDHQALLKNLRTPSPKIGSDDDKIATPAQWHIKLFQCLCLFGAKELADALKHTDAKYFVLAFDECSQLGIYKPHHDNRYQWKSTWGASLIALQRIIKAGDVVLDLPITFWHLLLDTSSSIFDMIPHGPNAPSHRLTKELMPLPPWTYLGFNQMTVKDTMAKVKKAADVLSVQHLKTYGRPYWSTLSNEEVVTAASEKLFYNKPFNPKNKDHVLAAFAVRIGLEIGEGEASARLTMEAVRCHMRIVTGVVDQLLITTAPSEPMLAIAAANALNTSNGIYQQAIETLVDKLILRGLVLDRGLQGELYSRLLFTLACDKAMTQSGTYLKNDSTSAIPMVRAVVLPHFLQTLLGMDLGIPAGPTNKSSTKGFPKTPPHILRNQLLHDMSDVWINFTHFVPLSKPIHEVTSAMLFEAWSSGFAFQCAFNQPVISGLIVAYFGKINEPFDVSQLFVIPWQTKAKSDAASLALASQLTAPFLASSTSVRLKPLHLVILMDLGAGSTFGSAKDPHCDLTFGKAEHPAKAKDCWGGYSRPNEVEGDRYCLNIRGHSSYEYPVLEGFEDQFTQLFHRSSACAEPRFMGFAELMEQAMERVEL